MRVDKYFTTKKLENLIQGAHPYYREEVVEYIKKYSLDIIKTVTNKKDWGKLENINNHVAYKRFIEAGLGGINDYIALESDCQNIDMNSVVSIVITTKNTVYYEVENM